MNDEVTTYENHAQDSRVREIEVSDTRSQKDGTGGNNLPLVLATFGKVGHAVNADGDGERYAPVEVAQTLNTFQNQCEGRAVELCVGFSHVASGMMLDCQPSPTSVPLKRSPGGEGAVCLGFKAGQSANGGLGVEAEVSPTMSHQPSALEPTVCIEGDLTRPSHMGSGVSTDGASFTLQARDAATKQHGVAFAQNTRDELRLVGGDGQNAGALSAEPGMKQQTYVALRHIVRRLTPTEAERLQGFPSNFTEAEVGQMTKDEFIAWELMRHNIECDIDNGLVFTLRGPGGHPCERRLLRGTPLHGYLVVTLKDGGVCFQCRIHRIVWIAAHGIPAEGMVIDHINNNKADNRICNLQLLTTQENSTKAAADGLYRTEANHPHAKLTQEQHNEIQAIYDEGVMSIRSLARRYGISKSRVSQIIHEGAWTRIPYRGKPADQCPDSPRYKALGNSWATNCAEWILRRIVAAVRLGLIPEEERQ